jgi:hypothetical protein
MDMLDEKLLKELQEYVEKHLERLGYVLYEPARYDSMNMPDIELDIGHDYIGLPDTELENFISGFGLFQPKALSRSVRVTELTPYRDAKKAVMKALF